jgi:aspartate/methionine/tyrosine aminotransferase
MKSKAHHTGTRLGYLLTEEQTERVLLIMDYMDMHPYSFMDHCIDVLWEGMNS